MSAATGKAGQAMAGFVSLTTRFPVLTILLVMALVAASVAYIAAGNLRIDTNTADMISDELPWRQDFINYRDGFPARDGNLVVVIDGPDGATIDRYARALVSRLAAEPELFPMVFLPGHGEFFDRNGLLMMPIDELDALYDRLSEAQPLLGSLSGRVNGAGVLAVLDDAITAGEDMPASMGTDIDRILDESAATLAASRQDVERPVQWAGMLGLAAPDTTRQLMLVRPAVEFSRARPARESIERLREMGSDLSAEYNAAVTLRLTGNLAMEDEEMASVVQSARTAGLASLVMVVVVLLWVLRSPVLLVIAVVTLLTGLCLTAGFAAVAVGRLNLLSVAFAVLYVGLGVDFILHLMLRLRELQAEGVALKPALLETAGGVGGSLLICAITTAIGFLAFVPTDFVGISELGIISGGGMFISLFVSLTLLPALLRLFWRGGGVRHSGRSVVRFRSDRLPPRLVVGVAGVIAVVALWFLPGLSFDGNPIHLRDQSEESVRTLEDLSADSEAPVFNLAVLVGDADEAETVAAAVAALPSVEQTLSLSSLVPADQDDKMFTLDDIDLVMGSTIAGFAAAPSDAAEFVAALEQLAATLSAQPANAAQQRWLNEAARWLAAHGGMAANDAQALALQSDAGLRGDLVEQVQKLESGLMAEPFGPDDLPIELKGRWMNDSGQQLVEIVPAEDLSDDEAASRFVAAVQSVAPTATGLPVVYERAAATVTRAFTVALVYAFIAVSLLLLVFMRSLRDALMVLVPIVFAAVVTAGISVGIGLPLNFANIIALPLLIGVGVDSGIHMVHRMRTEPPKDGDPLRTSTSRAVFASAVTTIASFGNLAFSVHPGMASMGQLLTIGMLAALFAILIVLPAMMRLGRPA